MTDAEEKAVDALLEAVWSLVSAAKDRARGWRIEAREEVVSADSPLIAAAERWEGLAQAVDSASWALRQLRRDSSLI